VGEDVLPAGRMFLFSKSFLSGLRSVRKDSNRSLVNVFLDRIELPWTATCITHEK
jgi:hypothetical protein